MLPIEFFNKFYNTIDFISAFYGLAFLRSDYKVTKLTQGMFLTMFVSIPLIIYTVVTYDRTTALRSLTIVGVILQVKSKR